MILTRTQSKDTDAIDRLTPHRIDPRDLIWRAEGANDPLTTLRATLEIGGCRLSLFAIEIAGGDETATQYIVDGLQWDMDALWQAFALDGAVQTVEIGGRGYALFAAPEAS